MVVVEHSAKECSLERGECHSCVAKDVRATRLRSPLAIRIHGLVAVFKAEHGYKLPEGAEQ